MVFLGAVVDAVFQRVAVKNAAVEIQVRAGGFVLIRAVACVFTSGFQMEYVGFDVGNKAQVCTFIFEVGPVLGIGAVGGGVACEVVELFAQGARAVGLFLAAAQFDAVVFVDAVADFRQQAALAQRAERHAVAA